ncbi:O-unit flippase-like protein [Limosilactobacillus panis]|uniref:Polysaccharide biosynthesis protein n=1 Tax=Limosilactobacillus panis DSM 6035 TaxID=1423782 RepID=A0A0R1XN10_9LACO|nr:O-unit flippase-like protein [Limosilactobacillus panis]KRM29065.1 polysaccharide biosynthesis protein [Limosilactobacillus panis DSM 6035]
MRINISKSDIFWNYIGIIVSLAGNFLLIPFLLKFLTTEYYGLWNVFISLGAISVLFDFGFNSMFARNIAYSWSGVEKLTKENVQVATSSKVNFVLLKKVIKTCKRVYLIISLSALVILASVGTIYIIKISKNINEFTVVVAWLLYVFGIFLDLLYGYYDAFLRGIGEIGADNKARVISKMLQIILTILLLFLNFGILSTSISNIVYGLVFRGICKNKFYKFHNMKNNLQKVGEVKKNDLWDTFTVVWHNAWREGIVSIANFVSNQVTTILCSFYLGLVTTASFGLAVQFTSAVAQIATSLFSSYLPIYQEAYSHRDITRIREKFSVGFVTFFLLYPIGIMGIMLFIPIINIIKSKAILSVPIIVGVGIYQFLLKYRDCFAWYLAATNRIIYYKSFLMASIICTILSVIFVGYFNFGIRGFIYAQIISQLIHNVWYWPRIVMNELSISHKKMLKIFLKYERNNNSILRKLRNK